MSGKSNRDRVSQGWREKYDRHEREMRADPKAPHRFVVYRVGEDVCARCRKPRAEHLPADVGSG